MVELSIIIPSYNEEKNLKLLLESIKKQKYDCEIIVSDADSKDKTVSIAEKFGCKVVKGGLPAKGRNNGAKKAKGDLFLFLDADVILPKNFLKKSIKEFNNRNLDMAGVDLVPITNNNLDYFLHNFYNFFQRVMQYIDPHASGACIFIKKKVFFDVKGFDENLIVAEDHALARKVRKKRYKFRILNKHVLLDIRRLKKEGRFGFVFKLFFFWFRRLFGEIKKSRVKYELKDRD